MFTNILTVDYYSFTRDYLLLSDLSNYLLSGKETTY